MTAIRACVCVFALLVPAAGLANEGRPQETASKAAAPASDDGAAAAPVASRAQTTTGETLEEIAARVRRRLAAEQAALPRRPAKQEPPAPPPAARVRLVWRPSLVWPAEVTGADSDEELESGGVRLSWDDEGPAAPGERPGSD